MNIWMAVYTNPRHEKVANKYLHEKNITTYLPLIKVKRKWSDRYKWIEQAMFKSYIFVHEDVKEYMNIIQTHGVHHIVKIANKIVPVRQSEILGIKRLVESEYKPEPTDYFVVGDDAEIIGGPLKGLTGLVSQIKGEEYFVLKIDIIKHAIKCKIERRWLKNKNNIFH